MLNHIKMSTVKGLFSGSLLNRELSVVEMDQLFEGIKGYERIGSTCSVFNDYCNIHWHVQGWKWIMISDMCCSILCSDMSIHVGFISKTFMVNHIPGLQNPELG
jgi:hypothetical protein